MAKKRGIDKAIEAAGGVRALARELNVGSSLVAYWKRVRVPADRVHEICEAVNHEVAPADLRPDLFRDRAA